MPSQFTDPPQPIAWLDDHTVKVLNGGAKRASQYVIVNPHVISMPRFEIKVTHEPNVQVPGFTREQMEQIGQFAASVMKERVAEQVDVLDRPAPPLRPKYRRQKERKGLPPVRDLRYTGDMLAAMQILESSDAHVKIGLKGTKSYRKGLFNQNIDPWFGVSTTDDTKILSGIVEPIFHKNISDIG
jgi:hypothetical protein